MAEFVKKAKARLKRGELRLDSATGSHLPNHQANDITVKLQSEYDDLARQYGSITRERSAINPQYNCHGLTFASRRTAIHAAGTLARILQEDGYKTVNSGSVLEGDVILYRNRESGDIEHSGIVVAQPTPESFGMPLVISKWGYGGEYVHYASQCPYDYSSVTYHRRASPNDP